MAAHSKFINSVYDIIEDGKRRNIIHLATENESLEDNSLQLNQQNVINFGSCSYLGLEFDERIIRSSVNAVRKYGAQFSASRAYVSLGLYNELEQLFDQIFDAHCIVTQTTSLGHIATIPVVVKDGDAVIVDHQVHSSVQTAVALLKSRGVHVELVRHNNMDSLEEKIIRLKKDHGKVWYMADGIYSMYGDAAPTEAIEQLLDKYEQFHFYVDDAHGMSCFGKHGRGYVLDNMNLHPKMILAVSLAKAFATGGAVMVFPNEKMKRLVRNCGGPLITSGPLQPATLGAAIASAKIHLSEDIEKYQAELQQKIRFTNLMMDKLDLPYISNINSPVFFVGVSLPKIAYESIEKLLDKGHYVNLGIFPAVPMKNTGIRFTITRLHTFEQIQNLLVDMKAILDQTISDLGFSYEKIYRAFKLDRKEKVIELDFQDKFNTLSVEKYTSISEVPEQEWDEMFQSMGIIDTSSLELLENTFTNNLKKEHNWDFEYIIIRDDAGKPVLATFITVSLCKEDMMSSKYISKQIEEKRKQDPYYLTAKVLSVGTPLTEGQQIYIDRNHADWKNALSLLIDRVNEVQAQQDINQVIIRDFEEVDADLERVFIDNGFFKYELLNNNVIEGFNWTSDEDMISGMSKRNRSHFRKEILQNKDKFNYVIDDNPTEAKVKEWYELYSNVKENNLTINTFDIPLNLFKGVVGKSDWRVFEIHVKDDFKIDNEDKNMVAMGMVQINGNTVNCAIAGIDYKYQKEYRVYLQLIYAVLQWAKENGMTKMNLGYTADTEKKKVGAKQVKAYSFMQIKDNFNFQVLSETDLKKIYI